MGKGSDRYIAGTVDFLFIYRYMFDQWMPELETAHSEIAGHINEAIKYENAVPDREILFIGCALDIMDEIGVKQDWKK